ncbi:MAG: 2-hydroxy-3-oxopropionate reductase [Defluviitaleaceae bacterium]|nr:2-hydroxy-3-oxopropionate reductase [Defluviitaleaceae bacterium]
MFMKIGFIGLGIMGKPMVKNLLKAGCDVVAYSRTKADVDAVVAYGATSAETAAEVAAASDVIITMLPNGPDVAEVVMGEVGILSTAKDGTILVDMSSIAPAVAQEIHTACATKGVKMLDAPVSGGEPKAIDGTLSIMVGGDEAVFKQVYEILLHMGASAVYCGDIGAGNITKLANNIIVALNIAAVGEAIALSNKAGVDPNRVFAAIKGGLAGSNVMNAKLPMIIDENFTPGFKLDLHVKDLLNAVDAAKEVNAQIPFTNKILEVMQSLQVRGYGQNDHSVISKHYTL